MPIYPKFIFLLTILSFNNALAQDLGKKKSVNEMKIFEYSGKIQTELETLKNLTPEEYVESVLTIRSNLKSYIEHGKGVCLGEFKTLILQGQKGIISQKKSRRKVRLSKKEKTLCYLEMKNIQESYILGSYISRKRFLDDLHEKKLSELKRIKDRALSQLRKTFN